MASRPVVKTLTQPREEAHAGENQAFCRGQHQLTGHARATVEVAPQPQTSLQVTAARADTEMQPPERLEPEPPSQATSDFLMHRKRKRKSVFTGVLSF